MAVKRTRKKKPELELTGIRAENWRSNTELLQWAQTSSVFRQILTVIINERQSVSYPIAGDTENVQLGRYQGYDIAQRILESLAKPMAQPSAPSPEATYPTEDFNQPVYD